MPGDDPGSKLTVETDEEFEHPGVARGKRGTP